MTGVKCIGRFGKWILIASSAAFLLTGCARIGQQFKAQEVVRAYEAEHYNKNLYTGELFASDLCVASENVAFQGAPDPAGLHAAGLFDVEDGKVDFAYNLHDRLYPASTTKIMTALVALKKGNLTDMVTVQADADAANFAADEKTCGIKAGGSDDLGRSAAWAIDGIRQRCRRRYRRLHRREFRTVRTDDERGSPGLDGHKNSFFKQQRPT